jgi:hypothetical protein
MAVGCQSCAGAPSEGGNSIGSGIGPGAPPGRVGASVMLESPGQETWGAQPERAKGERGARRRMASGQSRRVVWTRAWTLGEGFGRAASSESGHKLGR